MAEPVINPSFSMKCPFLTSGRLTKPKLCGRVQLLVRKRDAVTVSCTVEQPKSTEGTLNSRSATVT